MTTQSTKKIHRKKRSWIPILGIVIIALIAIGAYWFAVTSITEKLHQSVAAQPNPPSPGELVDRAMSISGAVVLTPHRDLNEVGFDLPDGARVGSPSIAVMTKHGFCVWELGNDYLIKIDSSSLALRGTLYHHDDQFVGSNGGYQAAYDSFLACIAAHNTVDPVKDYGAICDGKHDTSKAFQKAAKEAMSLPQGRVHIPDNCATNNLTSPTIEMPHRPSLSDFMTVDEANDPNQFVKDCETLLMVGTPACIAFHTATRKYGYTFIKSDEKSKLCIDGQWFKVLHVDPDHNWMNFCAALRNIGP